MRGPRLALPPGSQKPPAGAQLDRGHPYATGMQNCILFSGGPSAPPPPGAGDNVPTYVDLVSATRLQTVGWSAGNYANDAGPGGYAIAQTDATATRTARLVTTGPTWPTVTAITFMVRLRRAGTPSGAGSARYLCSDLNANGTPFLLGSAADTTQPRMLVTIGGVNSTALGAAGALTARWLDLAGTWDGTTIVLYLAGVPVASTAASGAVVSSGSQTQLFSDANSDTFLGAMEYAYTWKRALAASEIAALTSQPYQLLSLSPTRRWFRLFVPPSSAPSASGHITLNSPTVAAATREQAAAGSVTLNSPSPAAVAVAQPTATGAVLLSSPSVAAAVTVPAPTTKTYTPTNLVGDSAATIDGGSSLRFPADGSVKLAYNLPAVTANVKLFSRTNAGTGTTVTDASANANNGSLGGSAGNPKWTKPFAGEGCARFNVPSNNNGTMSVDCGAVSALNWEYTQPWTIYSAFLLEAAPTAGGACVISTTCNVNANGNRGWELWVDDTSHLHVRIISSFSGGQYIGVHGGTNVADGVMHRAVATYDGSGTAAGVKIYLDGALETLTTESDTLGGNSIVPSPAQHLLIGNQTSWTFSFNGLLDEYMVFNVAQNATWASTYASSVPPVDATCQIYLPMDERSGLTFADKSGNGRDGTLSDAAILAAPLMATSQLTYFGTDRYISFPHIADYNLGSAFTLGPFWGSIYSTSNDGTMLFHYNANGWIWGNNYTTQTSFYDGVAFRNSASEPAAGWHCQFLTYDGTNYKFYLDGSLAATVAGSTPVTQTTPLLVGNWNLGYWQGYIGPFQLANVVRTDIATFSKMCPAAGIASLASPATAVASGGGDYGTSQAFSTFAAAFSTPTTSALKFRIAASDVSAADATAQKVALGWTTLAASNAISVAGRWVDFDIQFLPSTDTLARDTPSLTSLTLTYAPNSVSASGAPVLNSPSVAGTVVEAFTAAGAVSLTSPSAAAVAQEQAAAGSIGLNSPSVVGAAVETFTAAGVVTLSSPSLAAVAQEQVAAGSVSVNSPTVAAAAVETFTAAGSVALDSVAVSSTAAEQAAAGNAILSDLTVGALASETFTAAGAITLSTPDLGALATESFAAAGAPTLSDLSAGALATETFSAAGNVTLTSLSLAAAAIETFTTSGAVTLVSVSLLGAAEETFTAAGAVSLASPSVAAAVTTLVPGASAGSVTLHSPSLTATAITIAAAVAITLTSPFVGGVAEEIFAAAGAVLLASPSPGAAAEQTFSAAGDVLLESITLTGVAEEPFTAAGDVTLESVSSASGVDFSTNPITAGFVTLSDLSAYGTARATTVTSAPALVPPLRLRLHAGRRGLVVERRFGGRFHE